MFKDAKGRPAHVTPPGAEPGHDWALSKWSNAVAGEVGEAANIINKIERGDYELDEILVDEKTGQPIAVRDALGKELADAVCYLDLVANRAGVDLGAAVLAKFNEVSDRQKLSIKIAAVGGDYRVVDETALVEVE
jgi:NTP pyrophosphatase (non-canonical NTP hydrolase)